MAKYRGRFEHADAADTVGATMLLVALTMLLVGVGMAVSTPWLRWPAWGAAALCGTWVWLRRERGLDGQVRDVAKRLAEKRER